MEVVRYPLSGHSRSSLATYACRHAAGWLGPRGILFFASGSGSGKSRSVTASPRATNLPSFVAFLARRKGREGALEEGAVRRAGAASRR